jgi:hypothetical protein
MTTIREKLNRWRTEDVDANTFISDEEIDKLEDIIREITLDVAHKYLKVINEIAP